jgi:elongator complex protein 4
LGLALTGPPLQFPEFRLGHRRSFKMAAADTCGAGTLSSRSVASEAGQGGTSSFQRKGKASGGPGGGPRLLSIAGTRPSVRNGQLLVSTGLPALDQLLGRFRINMWARSRRNLGEGLLGSPSPLCLARPHAPISFFPLFFISMVRMTCPDRGRLGGNLHGDVKRCALSPP